MSDVSDQREYYERMMDEVGAEYRRRISDLQDENDKLREQGARLFDKTLELGTENAKLRELVLDAWGDGHPDRSCDGCDIRDECHDDVERMRKDGVLRFSRCLFELRIEERMRELGIEVDG